jgi:hypothetical protein
MRFHGVFLGSQHEIWSKQHNGKVSHLPLHLLLQSSPCRMLDSHLLSSAVCASSIRLRETGAAKTAPSRHTGHPAPAQCAPPRRARPHARQAQRGRIRREWVLESCVVHGSGRHRTVPESFVSTEKNCSFFSCIMVLCRPPYAGAPSPRGFLALHTSLTKPPINETSLCKITICNYRYINQL